MLLWCALRGNVLARLCGATLLSHGSYYLCLLPSGSASITSCARRLWETSLPKKHTGKSWEGLFLPSLSSQLVTSPDSVTWAAFIVLARCLVLGRIPNEAGITVQRAQRPRGPICRGPVSQPHRQQEANRTKVDSTTQPRSPAALVLATVEVMSI